MACAPPPEYRLVAGATHDDFTSTCSARAKAKWPQLCHSPLGLDRDRFQVTFVRSVTKFFTDELGIGVRSHARSK